MNDFNSYREYRERERAAFKERIANHMRTMNDSNTPFTKRMESLYLLCEDPGKFGGAFHRKLIHPKDTGKIPWFKEAGINWIVSETGLPRNKAAILHEEAVYFSYLMSRRDEYDTGNWWVYPYLDFIGAYKRVEGGISIDHWESTVWRERAFPDHD